MANKQVWVCQWYPIDSTNPEADINVAIGLDQHTAMDAAYALDQRDAADAGEALSTEAEWANDNVILTCARSL